jgi:hypothetical protein
MLAGLLYHENRVAISSETLTIIYKTVLRHILEDCNIDIRHSENPHISLNHRFYKSFLRHSDNTQSIPIHTIKNTLL